MYLEVFNKQKKFHQSFKALPFSHRKILLNLLKKSILEHQEELCTAFIKDFNKSKFEALLTEIFPLLEEIKHTTKSLNSWGRPKKVKSSWLLAGTESYIQPKPKGTVLIISPWNFPFILALQPLVSALAAGNTVFLKPSELTPHVSAVIQKILNQLFEEDLIYVAPGGKEVTQELLKLPFDHIFFTGSTTVGKIIMQAASEKLIPVTLELGGKSPCVVDETADLAMAAKKIIWAKGVNNGQACIAPDYLLVHKSIKDQFLEILRKERRAQNTEPCNLINEKALRRIDDLKKQQNIVDNFFILEPQPSSSIMQEEIFGPLLPILSYEHLDEIIAFINSKDKPLALYIFSNDKINAQKILAETISGGACINEIFIHVGNHHLPFGGVGASGIGSYHGEFGFREFSHQQSVLKRKRLNLLIQFLSPPHSMKKLKLIEWLIKIKSGPL